MLAYPPEHAKHRSVILGKRGLNVTGTPVYKGMFRRDVHVGQPAYNPQQPPVSPDPAIVPSAPSLKVYPR